MRVTMFPDPFQFERPGGLRAQVCETINALERRGHAVALARSLHEAAGCDVLHVLGAGHGHGRAVREAVAAGLPVVLAPRLSPAWNSASGTRARVADRVLGNHASSEFDTGYAQIRRALQDAHVVAALGEPERKSIRTAFLIKQDKIRLVPNGIAPRFYRAEPTLFRERTRIDGRFALVLGQVSPWNGQLDIARTLLRLGLPLVVAGEVAGRDATYAAQLRAQPLVTVLGAIEHDAPLLASAYAAASMLVVAGQGSALPNAALEALAAGTPVVATYQVAGLSPGVALRVVQPNNAAALAAAASDLLESPPGSQAARAAVDRFSWQTVAERLEACYREAVSAVSSCRASAS